MQKPNKRTHLVNLFQWRSKAAFIACMVTGTICITLTLVFVLIFISWYDPELAFGKENFFLHIICPLAVLISFFIKVESDIKLEELTSAYTKGVIEGMKERHSS